MKTNPELFDLADVCAYFSLSESSIRRRVRDTRNNNGTFPIPLHKSHCRLVWRKSDIVNWAGEDNETITFDLPPVPPFPKVTQSKTDAQVRQGLRRFGIDLPPPEGTKPAPAS